MTESRAQVSTPRGYMFWGVYHWQVSSFQLIAGSTIIGFLYYNVFSLRRALPLASAKYIYCTLQNEWNTLGCSPGTTGGTATAHMKWDIIPLRRYKHCHSHDQYTAGTYKLHIPRRKNEKIWPQILYLRKASTKVYLPVCLLIKRKNIKTVSYKESDKWRLFMLYYLSHKCAVTTLQRWS